MGKERRYVITTTSVHETMLELDEVACEENLDAGTSLRAEWLHGDIHLDIDTQIF